MARAESRAIMGYLPLDEKHVPAVLSLLDRAPAGTRVLDPFAGEGIFLEQAAAAWGMTPYANELDGAKAALCVQRFGVKHAVRSDAERLNASLEAFQVVWCNPPYDTDKTSDYESRRLEYRFLRHSWKWAQPGAVFMWVVYMHHVTEAAAEFLAKHSSSVDVWALPGKHLGEYDQVILVAVKGEPADESALYESILKQRETPLLLTVQDAPRYTVPTARPLARFVFAPDIIEPDAGARLLQEAGAWKTNGFQMLLSAPPPPPDIEPVVAPRPGHMALVLAGGVTNNAILDTFEYGRAALRSKIERVEDTPVVVTKREGRSETTETTIRLKPKTILTLLGADGSTVRLDGDEALLGFISANRAALVAYLNERFRPVYQFDYAGIGGILDSIRLNGKHKLFVPQRHVAAAAIKGFERRKGILLVGQMGVGKTAIGGTVASIMGGKGEGVVLIVAPPHLVRKWARETASIYKGAYIRQLDNVEQVKAFMEHQTPAPKIGIIKRDMTKLGGGRAVAVVWQKQYRARWRRNQLPPSDMRNLPRLYTVNVPTCPTCGEIIKYGKGEAQVIATAEWLEKAPRTCTLCHTPLWQEKRNKPTTTPKGTPVTRTPKYRLDEYIKRRYSDRIALLIWDEVHEAQHADTGNGEAFTRFANVAKHVLAMTGTPFNGRASSIFNLEYMLNPRVREQYAWGGAERLERKTRGAKTWQVRAVASGQRGASESRWVANMGVLEKVIETRSTFDPVSGALTGTKEYERPYSEAPGVSPLLIAEALDHTIYFSLADLGNALPQYEEIAVPVDAATGVQKEYDRVKAELKAYLRQRSQMGDSSFRGAYLQWALSWVNIPCRKYPVIHKIRNRVTGALEEKVVATPAEFSEEYTTIAKEDELVSLLRGELRDNRPCVVYVRQTGTRDIQPHLAEVISGSIPEAKVYVLRQSVSAERRESVIQQQIDAGCNVLICNPELVKTGLDLLHFPTLIFFEITFNLSTMMQASARAYRLNQTHERCTVYYLYYTRTMEEQAVALMSRKQRAAKLLTGDIGLSGLDALTESEGSFEQALLDAIGRDESISDPRDLFKRQGQIDRADLVYWGVVEEAQPEAPAVEPPAVTLTRMSDDKRVWYWINGVNDPKDPYFSKIRGVKFAEKRKQFWYLGAELPPALAGFPVEQPKPKYQKQVVKADEQGREEIAQLVMF